MTASVIMTVLNEARSIESTINKILEQIPKESEIVIIDAGSSDNTVGILSNIAKRDNRVKYTQKPGVSRGLGRNVAITLCKNDIIISIDAGCIPTDGWYEALIQPFKKPDSPDVVGGYWIPIYESIYGQAVAKLTKPPLANIKDSRFLPSSRCIAFKKKAWEAVGGYPDENFGEDTFFDLALKKQGFKFEFVPSALVYWEQRNTLGGIKKQFFNYGLGSAKLGLIDSKKFASKLMILFSFLILCHYSWLIAGLTLIFILIIMGIRPVRVPLKVFIAGLVTGIVIRASTLAGELYGTIKKINFETVKRLKTKR